MSAPPDGESRLPKEAAPTETPAKWSDPSVTAIADQGGTVESWREREAAAYAEHARTSTGKT